MGLLTRSRPSVPATVDRIREEFDNAIQHLWSGNGDFELLTNGDWQPRIDVSETADSFEVKVDLPGIKPEDVDISVSDDRLVIQGERQEEQETKDKTQHRVERSYGSFYRSISLPIGTEGDKVSAESDNGVITVNVPKGAKAKAKKIAVKPK